MTTPPPPSLSLHGTTALITGGSLGLGRALGLCLGAAGVNVVLVARHPEPLQAAVAAIRAAGGQAHAVIADIADVADLDQTAAIAGQAAAIAGGPIDLLINNASTLGPQPLRLLLDTDCEDLSRALAVNLVGAFRLTKAVAGAMVLRGAGTIVNISSDAAVAAYPHWGVYGASKAALDHLGRIWAAELDGTGVRVLNVDPGEMNTRMHAEAMPDADPRTLADPVDVAARLVALLQDPAVTSGTRLSLAEAAPAPAVQ